MALHASEFREWISALYEHPEWREELRRLVLTDELLSLPQLFRELAEVQRRTDEQLNTLTARVDALAERVEALAEAQRRTDEQLNTLTARVDALAARVDALAERVEALAEAQQRTEKRLDALEQRMNAFKTTVDRLQQTFGATLEEEAAEVLEWVLRQKGYTPLDTAVALSVNGEVDVIQAFEDAAGNRVWFVVEVKARLSRHDVSAWVQRMSSPDWRRRLAKEGAVGPYYLYFYVIRFDKPALEAIRAAGVGLLKSDGEVVAAQLRFDAVS